MTTTTGPRTGDPNPIHLEMLDLISQGYSPQEAQDLIWEEDGQLIEWTKVKTRLLDQLGATNELHAVRRALERGLLRTPR